MASRVEIERPVLRYFGGKFRLAPWVIEYMPPHDVYCEPFGGAASVLMRKPRARSEIYNDLNEDIVNVFRVLRDRKKAKELERLIRLTPFSRDEFESAYDRGGTDVERARRQLILSFMAHGSTGCTKRRKPGFRANSFLSTKDSSREWQGYPDQIRRFTERLQGVIIERRDALKVMAANDSPRTLFYVDPPYHMDTRTNPRHGYAHEMDHDDHVKLAEFMQGLKGMVMLSAYRHDVYESMGWISTSTGSTTDAGQMREEVLYLNPAAADAQNQLRFNGL